MKSQIYAQRFSSRRVAGASGCRKTTISPHLCRSLTWRIHVKQNEVRGECQTKCPQMLRPDHSGQQDPETIAILCPSMSRVALEVLSGRDERHHAVQAMSACTTTKAVLSACPTLA